MILGYGSGIQVGCIYYYLLSITLILSINVIVFQSFFFKIWAIPANGEASELLAWRQSTVRVLRILPTPKVDIEIPVDQPSDLYEQKRPLIAICDNSGSGPQYCSVNFVSLKDGDQVSVILNLQHKNNLHKTCMLSGLIFYINFSRSRKLNSIIQFWISWPTNEYWQLHLWKR